jgi:hypothetical protein
VALLHAFMEAVPRFLCGNCSVSCFEAFFFPNCLLGRSFVSIALDAVDSFEALLKLSYVCCLGMFTDTKSSN